LRIWWQKHAVCSQNCLRINFKYFSVQIIPKNSFNFNVDNIRVCKILGAGVSSSMVTNGMVFKRGAEGEVKNAQNAKVAIFACPFDLNQTETKVLLTFGLKINKFILGHNSDEHGQRFVEL
jgi:T-complex protein 1 subunit theta